MHSLGTKRAASRLTGTRPASLEIYLRVALPPTIGKWCENVKTYKIEISFPESSDSSPSPILNHNSFLPSKTRHSRNFQQKSPCYPPTKPRKDGTHLRTLWGKPHLTWQSIPRYLESQGKSETPPIYASLA